ncbi:MAG: hypothetical protein ACERKO_04000 [Acetanaerobacterium sp.]
MRKQITIAALLAAAVMLTTAVYADDPPGYDLRTVSGITAEELAPYMHEETRHLTADVVRICKQEGVSAEWIAVVMRWERRPELHNWFGWYRDDGSVMEFDTDTDCLEYCIPLIKSMYLTESGQYYGGGYDVAAVSRCYNDSDFWRDTISAGTLGIVEAFN